ncbi:probable salivary secreted peptide [Chrysoperla carnea]|uniref:probable salivary secreted peptide n=1 Tax=Chrysoperla carnea TaxID=189513 RepID=UPI001D092717|nr:probable salivary secreted peptide [Chrysoperla carnea]
MSVRSITFICLIALIATIVTSQRHNWQSGRKQSGDYLLDRQYVQNLSVQYNKVLSKLVNYPKTGSRREVIHFINATDQYTNGKGGFVSIRSGGVNYQYVQLNFTSQRSSGINYLLEIWGR